MATAPKRTTKARPTEPRRRTGGRSARVVRDVLAATLDELASAGYANLSVEAIASRAGVSRTTVYRRWPTKPDLVRAALLGINADRPPPPDTGTLRGDVTEILGRSLGAQSPRNLGLMRAVMAGIADPEVAAIARVIGAQHQSGLVTVVARGIERGELPRGTEPHRVVEPIVATFFMRSSMGGGPPGPKEVGRIVDLVLDGARSGAAVVRRGS
jgi:AcrR family transcriptional regulator